MSFFQMQTSADIKEVITTNDATIIGVLLAVVITFGLAVFYLFKANQTMYKEHISELKKSNDQLVLMNNSYNEIIKIIEIQNKK